LPAIVNLCKQADNKADAVLLNLYTFFIPTPNNIE